MAQPWTPAGADTQHSTPTDAGPPPTPAQAGPQPPTPTGGGVRPAAPADVVVAVAAGVSRLMTGGLTDAEREAHIDRLADLYAEHTDVRHPFAPLGDTPLRSRAELRSHFADGPGRVGQVERFDVAVHHIHQTADPEVVVFEFSYVGAAHDREFSVPSIFVVRVRDGRIVESRDYGHHIGLARSFGRLPALATALAESSAPGRAATATMAPG